MPSAEHLAAVMYTSGSTGRPKGVEVPHRAIVRLVRGADYARLTANEVFLQLAPLSFDASTFEIWGALLNGARLVIFPPELPSLAELGRVIREHGVTTLWLTAGLFHRMVEHDPAALQGVRQLLAGGDVLSPAHVRQAVRALGEGQLINGYGPTENTTFSCCYPVPADFSGTAALPIGRPIANSEAYVLDDAMQPVPVGVRGELYVGGDGLARGYLGRPELTAERFVPHPFSDEPGARLYRTGDFARLTVSPDGAGWNLEFLGRRDQQVKIRGFRIELAEIEAALTGHPGVRECVVVARPGTDGERMLLAYLVAVEAEAPRAADLRRFLAERLPDYMLPGAFVVLDALPLSANGKLDRRALPQPEPVRSEQEKTYLAPRDGLEIQLGRIWEKALGVRPVGVRDDFFELGGHSLLAVRLFAEMEKACGKALPLALLFEAPTIERLAEILRQQGWQPPWSSLVAIQPAGSRPPLFCIHGAGGHVLAYRHLAEHLGADQPVYGVQARGLTAGLAGPTSVEELAAHYLEEIAALQPEGPYCLAGFSFGAYVAYEMARQLHASGRDVALLALLDVGARTSGPPSWSLREKLRAHRDQFVALEPRDRAPYLRARVKAVREEAQEAAWRLAYRSFRRRERPLPRALRDLQMCHREALREYRLRPYPGRVTVFRAAERGVSSPVDARMGWGELALGGVEVYEVPGDHASLVKEPHVQVLAARLSACLQRAHADSGS